MPVTRSVDLLIHSAAELITLAGQGSEPRRGAAMRQLDIVEKGAVAVDEGRIVATGPSDSMRRSFRGKREIDAAGRTVLPGFVDPHTHPVFARTRENEFQMRVEGKTYQEIAKEGGGIVSAVRSTRAATLQELTGRLTCYLDRFLALGTTTIEAKSGYGLSTESEIKSLEAIRDASAGHPLDVVPTFLGAHEVPPEHRGDRSVYLKILLEEMLPRVAEQGLAEYCDVFCEKGVFEIDESRQILQRAKDLGLKIRLHADEFASLGGAQLGAELGAASADHLVSISEEGIRRMAEQGTVAILLPGTSYFVRLDHDAPARDMIEAGVAVALATDFNPGSCFTQSMPTIMNLAAIRLEMTPAESITAATLNAAHSLGRAGEIGSLHEGKQADLIVCSIPNHVHLAYEFGRNPVDITIKKGKIVYSRESHEEDH